MTDVHVKRPDGELSADLGATIGLGSLHVVPLDTPTLGDRSYLAHDGEVALVVDPQRDVDRFLALAQALGVRITSVFETHIHNDYVTGGRALAEATGAAYLVNALDPVRFDRVPVVDGDVVTVGRMRVEVLATPGHTFTHLSYALSDVDEDPQDVLAVFSGDSLLFGATGRPDLMGPEHTHTLVRRQHASARRLARLPDAASVLPTHGFGSFCSATPSEATASTIGDERRLNPVLTQDEESWVADLLAGLDEWPAYYARMAPTNLAGPGQPDLSAPAPADPGQIAVRIRRGEWVVDLRDRSAFAAGHVAGTLNFGIDGSFVTYLGWLIPADVPLTLLGSTAHDVATAQRELVRIGIERPASASTGKPEDWTTGSLASFPRATFADLAQVRHHRDVVVLDVRRDVERATGWLPGTTHVPLHELSARIAEVPDGEVWVHCAAGYRAAVAASLLAAHGRQVVAVDDDFANVGVPSR